MQITSGRVAHGTAALAVAMLSMSGCAYGEMRQVLRAQVASELSCPSVTVEKHGMPYLEEEGDDKEQYKVQGCDVMRTYICPKDDGFVSYDETHCEFTEGDSNAPTVTAEVAEGVEDPFADPPAEEPAAEEPAAEEPGAEEPAADKPAADKPAAEEKPAEEKPAE